MNTPFGSRYGLSFYLSAISSDAIGTGNDPPETCNGQHEDEAAQKINIARCAAKQSGFGDRFL